MELSRGQRVVLWLLDLAARARHAAYIVAPNDDGGPLPAEWERPESER